MTGPSLTFFRRWEGRLGPQLRAVSHKSGLYSLILAQVRGQADEIMSHLRATAGADPLLRAFNAARANVAARRMERRRQRALQVPTMKGVLAINHHHAFLAFVERGSQLRTI